MAPRGMKRASSTRGGRPAKRPSAANPALEQCNEIAHALAKANREVLPKDAADMLVSMVRPCLGVAKDARHEFQASVVDMVGRVLQSMTDAMEKDVHDRKAAVDGADADRSARRDAVVVAKDAIAGLKADVQAKTEALGVADKAAEETKAAAKAKDKALKEAEKEHKAAVDKGEALKAATEALEVLKTAAVGATPENKAHFKKLSQACADFKVEEDLRDAVLKCLKKEVAARQSFDGVAIESLAKALQDAGAALAAQLEALSGPLAEAQGQAKAAHDAAAAAGEALAAAKKAHDEACAAEKAGVKAVHAAEKRLGLWLHDTKATMDGYDQQLRALAALRSGPCAAFEALRDLQPEPEAPEEPEEPVEPEAAEEPAAAAEAEAAA
eukprot:SRR837773.7046.p1 GENE.SRR837773.7046~~SRR837773.7046.p1  ORF type:complete len:437 (+),score=181.56 SRR837773.7046:162-1313(+)